MSQNHFNIEAIRTKLILNTITTANSIEKL